MAPPLAPPQSALPPARSLPGVAVLSAVLAFVLSVVGLGLLWIAMAWTVQAAMLVPFALAAYGLGRISRDPRRVAIAMLCGAAPIGLLLTQFRNAGGSHLAPVLVVVSWVAGMVLGAALAARRVRRSALASTTTSPAPAGPE